MIVKYQVIFWVVLTGLFIGCQVEEPGISRFNNEPGAPGGPPSSGGCSQSGLECTAQTEQTDYQFYKMHSDGSRIGDLMPIFHSGTFYLYHLKDIWDDATHERHPWHAFTSTNLYSYSETGEIIASSADDCAQDFALGTGSVIEVGGTFYGFYTGHNPNACANTKEGIMLATSGSPDQQFTKESSFSTIYAPTGLKYDEQDNFRDPFVYFDPEIDKYAMLISARKEVNHTWKGVLAKFTSSDLWSWSYDKVFYDGGSDNFFMMETAEVFEMGGTYYLIFSDIDSKYVYYRKSSSINGPWSKPDGSLRFEGKADYAARTAFDGSDRYIFGWTHVNENHSDSGNPLWGGNLVAHKLYRKSNGDLAVTIPHTLESFVETNTYAFTVNSICGGVTEIDNNSYRLVSTSDGSVTNVICEPVAAERFEISTTVSYASSSTDFGFMIGACDGQDDFFSLRFVPGQSRFSLDKTKRSNLTDRTVPDNDVPFAMSSDTPYEMRIVIENSMVIVYVDNQVALSSRIYRAPGTHWGIFADNSDATFSDIVVTTP